jgi:hypothetical protein
MDTTMPMEQAPIAPEQKMFFNEVFGYSLLTTVVVCTYTIINLVAFIA